MRVNSVFTGYLTHRLAVTSGIAIMMLFSFTPVSASELLAPCTPRTETPLDLARELRAKQVNLIIRQIGHRLLLQAGDSSSRVLPVTEMKEGTFTLAFENQFVFNHDSLIALAVGLLPKTQFPSGYTVTVLDCMKEDIVFGFQLNNTSPDVLACSGRSSPTGCYTIEFAFPDFYPKLEQKKADIVQSKEEPKSSKVNAQEASPKLEEIKMSTSDSDSRQLSAEQKSPHVPNQQLAELKTASSDYPLINLIYSGMLVSLGVTLLIARFGKILTPQADQNQNSVMIKESVPEFPRLGKFLFDVKGQRLLPVAGGKGSEVISLTDKECKILELLNQSFGELIPRETLMQKVWLSEGVITGRSLDMFVSKLRKKLSSDPELRITNVHGKGYTLKSTIESIVDS